MAARIFVDLPVRNLNKSVEFFAKPGFTFNPKFTDETATCMIIVKPAHETFWGGYAGYFQDPDHPLWEVVWNPQWVIQERGITFRSGRLSK